MLHTNTSYTRPTTNDACNTSWTYHSPQSTKSPSSLTTTPKANASPSSPTQFECVLDHIVTPITIMIIVFPPECISTRLDTIPSPSPSLHPLVRRRLAVLSHFYFWHLSPLFPKHHPTLAACSVLIFALGSYLVIQVLHQRDHNGQNLPCSSPHILPMLLLHHSRS